MVKAFRVLDMGGCSYPSIFPIQHRDIRNSKLIKHEAKKIEIPERDIHHPGESGGLRDVMRLERIHVPGPFYQINGDNHRSTNPVRALT